ncbi:MAG: LbetaH super family domain-containing protein [Flavobacteriales bacterium]|jgi:UDP-N-acetylglucosamine diphosphorylase/glucosamine-1-phosphate N-acetyltransferase|uniref:putative sugar nucleotidyl transferase n=1 Tax=Blattabacterium sp. (Mastotermes darwiniensis) TaxID=39768 RepID=UPI000231DEE0|nr:putative sugar nucleotidyl transferase [Blattabacterium sp. (Mastotermes darwiniensis)]AER40788.1 putative sugar phosphate nucleotidyl transferase [Blattabacterium sp. (Mastotermes darwiniensis) str. MADAR]MDR1804633.1 LbetaH super family domain-containing protein [Flavobacteriales bacterium]
MDYFILYDGSIEWKNLLPLTFTRPISEIRLGIFTIRERWERYIGGKAFVITKPYLSKKYSFVMGKKGIYKNVLIINSSFLPNEELIQIIFELRENEAVFFKEKIVAVRKSHFSFENPFSLQALNGYKKKCYINQVVDIQKPWDIFMNNEIVLEKDFLFLTKGKNSFSLFGNNHIISKEKIFLEEDMTTENIVLNAKFGPIYLGKGVQIMEGSMIRGPAAICKKSILNMGTKIYGGTTIGPFCKIGGEIKNSVIFSYSNKAHDGFLGNTILGEWCNLGAGTNISNLRNDYSKVTVWNYEKKSFCPIDVQFFGMIMGDYSKSSINTQFNTATIVGVNASIFGYGFPPRYIPSFSLGGIQERKIISFKKVCETADIMMKRRDVTFSLLDKEILKYLYHSMDE